MLISISGFKRIVVLFWAVWWLIAFLTDFIGGLQLIGVPGLAWFKNGNYPFLVKSLAMYSVPGWLPALLYVGIVVWLLLSTLFFVVAVFTPARPAEQWKRRVDDAFIVSLGLWLAFFLADQIVLNFDLEQNHMVQGGFQLLTWMAIHLLPDDRAR